ncbi:DUF4054 domain-containing protein [Avibacterium paragallinarum]|uniref:DUF4054 domain-containing protein n=1 Tax=Avibacterium paragallinarum TaxID=728 RepID=UPI0018905607|nr:DUF4054 domain-containing protein [Avibacterium paragallinarum]QZP14635.1 DUF4054 domain-containing protein [Avibacterium paragallinarum]WAL56332.1 DUF4054 domain-containing protein [Avibacterium paragallinarum]WAM58917.1 DUF4054 domain-containing protein [Avibacterium paragallinarum]
MGVTALLHFFYPVSQKMETEEINTALELAESYRPQCLTEDKQDEAVAWYAAYLLAQSVEARANPLGIKREREGDLEREYFANGDSGSNAQRFLANFNALNDLCLRLGAITVGNNERY